MLFLYLLLLKVTTTLGSECYNILELNKGNVKEFVNPEYPLRDNPGQTCTWSVVAESHRRIILVCPFNDGSDTRTDKRNECGAEMSVKDVGGNPALYCRDKTFTRLGNSNRMIISYKNDAGKFYNRTSGFKCYLYAPLKSLSYPFNQKHKKADEAAPFGTCDYFIRMSEYDIVRLDAPKYTEEKPSWRRCRWTAAVTKGRQLAITCPFTNRPPNPLLTQVELCNGEFLIRTLQSSTKYYCNDKAFSQTSEKHTIVLEYMSLMRLPSEDFECYLHSKSPGDESSESITESSPYDNCDHFLELNGTVVFKSPSYPEKVDPGTTCRWTLLAPENNEISLSCLARTDSDTDTQGTPCHARFNITMPTGRTSTHCQDKGFYFFSFFRYNWMTITYSNPSSEPVDAFDCKVYYEPEFKCKNCTEILESENDRCFKLIKLNKRQVRQILSPNHPQKVPAGSTCSWTVVADTDRRIVLVCPFSHSLEKTYAREDPQPCNGQFSVLPDGGKETNHCLDRGFSRIGPSNRMVITFKNPTNEALDSFSCYVYAELKSLWDNNTETQELDYGGFDYKITLDGYNTTTLVPPSEPEDEKGWSKARWNISAPHGSRITIACHFTNKPPEPLTIQVVPCRGRFKILAEGAEKTYDCGDRAFSYATNNGWVVLSYENPQRRKADNFVCFAYVKENSTSDDAIQAEENCAHHVKLTKGEMKKLVNPRYPSKDDLGKNCTWTIFAEPDRRIILACPFNEGADRRTDKRNHCGARIKVWHAGEDTLEYCRDQTFAAVARVVTNNNRMFISYNNDYDNPYNATAGFICYVYAPLKALWDPVDLSQKAVETGSNFGHCDFYVLLERHDIVRLKLFDYNQEKPSWKKCRWTVASHKDSEIIVTCPFTAKPPDPLLLQMESCTGEFTVITSTARKNYHCSEKTFSQSSTDNNMVLEYVSLMRQPSEAFECYVHSKSNEQDKGADLIELLPYSNCDHFIQFYRTTPIKSPNYPGNADPGSACRWTVVSPVRTRMALHCDLRHLKSEGKNSEEKCNGEFTVMSLGKTENHCQDLGSYFVLFSRNNMMTVTYNNPSNTPARAVECFISLEKDIPLTDCETCDEYQHCDHIIKLNKREVKQLKSPNYPHQVPALAQCRWTVVAETDRKIVFVCPIFHTLKPQSPKDPQPFDGHFTVTPDGGWATHHSQDRGFFRIGGSGRMVITYDNPEWKKLDPFVCYLYAELEERWDQLRSYSEVEDHYFDGFNYNITLSRNSMTTLISPSDLEDQNGWSKSRWNVSTPFESRITIACHFTDKPPAPLMIQLVPCWGQFTILTKETVETYACADKAFSYSTYSGWAVLNYENPLGRPADNFVCFAYSEDNSTSVKVNETFENENCDHARVLAPNEYLILKSEEYLTKKEEGHASCRWMFIAPPQNRIRLDCHTPNGLGPKEAEEKGLICHGQLTVVTEGRNKTIHCSERSFTEKSLTNRLVMIYENGFGQLIEHFVCRVATEQKETWEIQDELPITSKLPYANCDQLHNMTYDEMVDVELPGMDKPGTVCRWTLVAPRDAQILISCPNNFVFYVKDQCNSYFKVSKGRRDETHYCRRDDFDQLTTNYWTIITYENPSTETIRAHFKCYAYVEKKLAVDSCVNCVGHEALDYSKCDIAFHLNKVGQSGAIQTPNYPEDMNPGMPCRWTIHSPESTAIFLECDLKDYDKPKLNASTACRGIIAVYTHEPDQPKYHCRHSTFTAGSSLNKLVITYGNQLGASRRPLSCNVTVEDATCNHGIKLPRMQYNLFYKLSTPFWHAKIPPACVWSFESEKNTQIYLVCSKFSETRYDSLLVSNTGDEQFTEAKFKTLDKTFTEISVGNKMTVLYNMTEATKPSVSIGCRIYVDKAPVLKQCNCGCKFNKLDPSLLNLDQN